MRSKVQRDSYGPVKFLGHWEQTKGDGVAQLTSYQTREALEVMLAYLLPGGIAVIIYPSISSAAAVLCGGPVLPQIPSELGVRIALAVLCGPLLRAMDDILYRFFLSWNILNHILWWKYRKLRARYLLLMRDGGKHKFMASISQQKLNLVCRCESLSDGYMWTSFLFFIGAAAMFVCYSWCQGTAMLLFSWVALQNALYYLQELLSLVHTQGETEQPGGHGL